MKRHIIYECDNCGKKSSSYEEIWACEARHLGLSPTELQEYTDLQEALRIRSHIVSREANDETRQKQDDAIQKILDFETKHNIVKGV